MHFKWILLIFSCLILSVSSARRVGGGGSRSSSASKGAIRRVSSISRPAASSMAPSSPRFSSSPSVRGRGPRTRKAQIHRAASAPPVSNPSTSGQSIPPPPSPGKPTPSSPAVITPMVVSPIMKIPPKRNTTTKGNSPTPKNSNRNLSNPGRNTTAQAKLPPLNHLQASNNSTGGGSKSGINLAKGNAFNNTITGSPKNTTKTLGLIGNASGKNTTGSAKPNVNGVPQVFLGSNIKQNFTVSSNQTRYNNTRNATGSGLQASVAPISKTQPSSIVNNGDAPRKPRNDAVGDLTKKIVKSVAAKPNNGAKSAKSANYGVNSGMNDQTNQYVWKSSKSAKSPSAPSKIMNNQIIIITLLLTVYFCNRK